MQLNPAQKTQITTLPDTGEHSANHLLVKSFNQSWFVIDLSKCSQSSVLEQNNTLTKKTSTDDNNTTMSADTVLMLKIV